MKDLPQSETPPNTNSWNVLKHCLTRAADKGHRDRANFFMARDGQRYKENHARPTGLAHASAKGLSGMRGLLRLLGGTLTICDQQLKKLFGLLESSGVQLKAMGSVPT